MQMLLSSGRDLQWVIEQLKAGRKIHSRPLVRGGPDERGVDMTGGRSYTSGSPSKGHERWNTIKPMSSTTPSARRKQPSTELEYKQNIRMFGWPASGSHDR